MPVYRDDDEWYESEASTRRGLVEEVRRIGRRTRTHPFRVIVVATLLTALVVYKLGTRKQLVEAEVVVALIQGSLSPQHNGIRADEVREYVQSVLLPNKQLEELIQRRKLYRVRPGFGLDAAVAEFREQFEIEVWKNTFAYNDILASNQHSARIGITVQDTDPDRAFDIAHDLATILTETSLAQHNEVAKQLARDIAEQRETLDRQLAAITGTRVQKEHELTAAQDLHKASLTQALVLQINELDREKKKALDELTRIADSRDVIQGEFASAGLDMSCEIVEERRPEPSQHRGFVLAMLAAVVGFGALLGCALVLGAFDSRVHDVDDIERLGLPILGHVPGFPGDAVGSLEQRGAIRRRVPSFLRWRSNR